ncbi:MAG: DUF4236 domain-containing protein [Candidatus Obscuribacterales bacterium]|nr:DUF4236 domain-containing protein [Candidatus Obscuribacterales bacterium]
MSWKFHFRRSRKIGPLRITQTQNGTSYSFGFPGARYSIRQNGSRQITLSIPGTGLSWTKTLGK